MRTLDKRTISRKEYMILLIKYQEKILMSAVSACKPYDPQLVNMDLHLLLSYPVLDHALGQTEERRLTFVRGEVFSKISNS